MKPDGITKHEWSVLQKRGHFKLIEGKGETPISEVIFIVHNPSKLHDSGYPFIRAFGVLPDGKTLVEMGWHDHYICNIPSNTDALGKNVWRLWSWHKEKVPMRAMLPTWTSSLICNDFGVWS